MKIKITIILILASFIKIQSQTIIPAGYVYGDWVANESPYLIQGDILVQHDDRLAIAPGVEVIFQGPYNFEIQGRLSAIGTPSEMITFTIEDTTGFYSGNFNGWSGLVFSGLNYPPAENSYINYCQIQFSSQNGICCIDYPKLIIDNSSISNNLGFGITLYDFSDIQINTTSIYGNKSGGIQAFYSAPQVQDFSIFENTGSGIKLTGNSITGNIAAFNNGNIYSNYSMQDGGGMAVYDGADITVSDVYIHSNNAVNGGGIYCENAEGNFNNVSVLENSADNGGGLCLINFGVMNFTEALIASNTANLEGGAAYVFDSELSISKGTISNNYTDGSCGGLYYEMLMGTQSLITNSIIWNNFPNELISTDFLPTVSYSDIKNGFEGIANIDEDPLFENPTDADYHLQWQSYPVKNEEKSPCIDAGNPYTSNDPDGTVTDMGAYFFDQTVFTSIQNSSIADGLTIYPNPVQNELMVNGLQDVSRVVITSLTGAVVYDRKNENTIIQITVSDLVPGVYFIHFNMDKNTGIVKKFIKK